MYVVDSIEHERSLYETGLCKAFPDLMVIEATKELYPNNVFKVAPSPPPTSLAPTFIAFIQMHTAQQVNFVISFSMRPE